MTEPITTTDAWDGHRLLGRSAPHCGKDLATPGQGDDPRAWFASHLAEHGCPDYVVAFEREARADLTDEHGDFDVDQIARTLHACDAAFDQVALVYDDLTGGRLSKPHSAAEHVIRVARERAADTYAEMLCDEIEGLATTGILSNDVRTALRAVADEWSEGAWSRHQDRRARRTLAEAAGASHA